MQPPRNLRELRGLQGRLAYIRRFISNLSGRCQPFTKLMKKGVSFIWDDSLPTSVRENQTIPHATTCPYSSDVEKIFPDIRSSDGSFFRSFASQNDDQGHKQAIYYLSRTMIGAEHRYNLIEKECLALVFAVQKMRHYLVGQTINVISKVNPLRLLMTKPSLLNGRLAKWAILLSQYEIHFLPQKP